VVQVVMMAQALAAQALAAQDTVRVRADGPPKWGAEVRLVQEVALGELDGPPEYAFGRIYQGALAPNGAFYLYDANDRQLRQYDTRGRFTARVGREGSGPGEYRYVGGIDVTRDGLLAVFDANQRRLTWFDSAGKFVRDFTISRGAWDQFVLDSAGRMYFTVSVGGTVMEGPGTRQMYLRLRQDGTVIDSLIIPMLASSQNGRRTFALSTTDGHRWNFTERGLIAPNQAGGYAAATTNAYRIVVNNGEESVQVIERSHSPVRLEREERADWLRLAEFFSRRPEGQREYEIPYVKPPLRALRTDNLGRIWAEVWVKAEKRNLPPTLPDGREQLLFWRERTTFDVISSAGEYLGRVALPAETVLLDIQGHRLLTRGKGPDGEDRVIVFRMAVPDRP
jgi:hypothetical protein